MTELIFKWLDFNVQTIFADTISIFLGSIVYIYIICRLIMSSNDKIKLEQGLFRFLSTTYRAVRWAEVFREMKAISSLLPVVSASVNCKFCEQIPAPFKHNRSTQWILD